MKARNIYDFDGTIYGGDSTLDFLRFLLRRKPSLIRFLPGQAWSVAKYVLFKTEKTAMKEGVYRIFRGCDVRALLPEFWETHGKKLAQWYLAQKREDDVVISASPEFLLAPVCGSLGIGMLIGSQVDSRTGKYTGKNCRGQEKVHRLAALGLDSCERFYSDSLSDSPVAALADEAWLIRKDGSMEPWPEG